jgi:large subunit ribosomal protein L29
MMTASRANQLREMTDENLQLSLTETQKELFHLRFQATTDKLQTPSNIRRLRRSIARIKTIQRERATKAS